VEEILVRKKDGRPAALILGPAVHAESRPPAPLAAVPPQPCAFHLHQRIWTSACAHILAGCIAGTLYLLLQQQEEYPDSDAKADVRCCCRLTSDLKMIRHALCAKCLCKRIVTEVCTPIAAASRECCSSKAQVAFSASAARRISASLSAPAPA
jgi:hypothetical protein